MTDEQIRQNAKEYAFALTRSDEVAEHIIHGYIKGAHSLDEEIGRMNTTIRLYANQIALLRKEIEQLRNPWISVEERLPEKVNKFLSDEVLVRYLRGGKEYTFVTHYDYEYQTWNIPNVTHWMPIPEV